MKQQKICHSLKMDLWNSFCALKFITFFIIFFAVEHKSYRQIIYLCAYFFKLYIKVNFLINKHKNCYIQYIIFSTKLKKICKFLNAPTHPLRHQNRMVSMGISGHCHIIMTVSRISYHLAVWPVVVSCDKSMTIIFIY